MAKTGIEYLHHQIHEIIEQHSFAGRLVLAMGSGNNVQMIQKYLDCYSLKIQAILDNNPKKWGKWYKEHKIFKPETILQPFRQNALVFIFSPQYAEQMKQQLVAMGYREGIHLFVLKDFRKLPDSWPFFCEKMIEAKRGMEIRKRILQKYGRDTYIFIVRGATGDTFFNGLYIDTYARKKGIERYVLAGDAKGLSKIAGLFRIVNTFPLNGKEAESLQQCYKFFRCRNIEDLFMWQNSLYFNRCQTRMHREFNFLDTYTYYIYKGFVKRTEWRKPGFLPLSEELIRKYERAGLVKGKTIIVAPFAYSVKDLPIWVWETIAEKLKEKEYAIFVNINTELEVNVFENMKTVFFSFDECEAILQYAGYFLALRSGLCDIVAMIPCKQVILYPEEMDPINYQVHRSDMIFSGFEAMGYDAEHIVEISSPVIQDIVCTDSEEILRTKTQTAYEELIEKVTGQF